MNGSMIPWSMLHCQVRVPAITSLRMGSTHHETTEQTNACKPAAL
jgi:hypothetical protein